MIITAIPIVIIAIVVLKIKIKNINKLLNKLK